jgi:hypothetical protein
MSMWSVPVIVHIRNVSIHTQAHMKELDENNLQADMASPTYVPSQGIGWRQLTLHFFRNKALQEHDT